MTRALVVPRAERYPLAVRRALRLVAPLLLAAACGSPPPPAPAETPAERDRRELTLQARRDWTPEAAARKLSILLIVEKEKVRRGESVRYRLEVRNLGRESLLFREAAPSFIKDGSLCGGRAWRVLVASAGEERALPCEPAAARAAGSPLELALKPGDYLLTRPTSAADRFRVLPAGRRFDEPGRYRLRVAYADGGLRAASEPVTVTVVR